MRITWRSDFDRSHTPERVIVPASKRQIVESPNPTLDKIEQDIALMASIAVAELATCRIGQRVSEGASTFSHFLSDLDQFEGQLRSLLLDTSLSRYQTARLNRTFRAYQLLRPIHQLRRHIEFPLLAIDEHNEFIRLELTKAVEAVVAQGRKAAYTMRTPGWSAYTEARQAQEQAAATVTEARRRFRAVLTPGAFRAAQAALLALEVAMEAFHGLAHEHSEVLRAEILNQMGPPPPRTLLNTGLSL